MYKTYDEAYAAAMDIIERWYDGKRYPGLCISENKRSKNARKTTFNIRFNSEDTNGEFIQNDDGSYTRLYAI